MLHLFRRKMFFVVKYFQLNYFLEKNDFLENIFWRLTLNEKISNNEKPSVMRFHHWSTGFRPHSSDFDYCCRIPTTMARFLPISPESGLVRPDSKEISRIQAKVAGIWDKWPDSSQTDWNLAQYN
jgi:hypothetical protein